VYLEQQPLARLVEEVARVPPMFLPGTSEAYSNEGYVLLAKIIESASGYTWSDYLRRTFIEPLGMRGSGVETDGLPDDRAAGYRATLTDTLQRVPLDEAPLPGASGIYGTAEDLLAWMRAMRARRLFQEAKASYGWGRRTYGGKSLIEQSGMVEGYSTYMAMYDEGPFVVVLSNVQSGMQADFGVDIAAVLAGEMTSVPPSVVAAPLPETAVEFAAAYDLGGVANPFRLRLGKEGLESTWGPFPFWRPVTFIGSDQFVVPADFTLLTARRDATGVVTGLRMQRLRNGAPAPDFDLELTKRS
jgi:CubicO group peptidase (beta-lactamase class C family)